MSRFDEGLGAHSDDPDDVEVGCLAFSKTHVHTSGYPRGGTVVGLILDADDSVLSVITIEQGVGGRIDRFEIDRSDLNLEAAEWYGRNATAGAKIITDWLASSAGPRDRRVRALWQRTALELAEAGLCGQWLPKAEHRYQRHQSAKRAAS